MSVLSSKTRLGNWQEEIAFEEDKKRLRENIAESGGLLSQRILAKVRQHSTPVELAPVADDTFLRFGVPVMLQNADTVGVLSVDMDDKSMGPTGWKVNATTATATHATVRNAWILVPAPSADDVFWKGRGEADVVHYGQKFVIRSVPELAEPPVFLTSEMKSPQSCSKVTKNQEVYFSTNGGAAALWTVEFGNIEYRDDVVGQPAKATSMFVVRHVATNNLLAATSAKFNNDFGPENEVCCAKFQGYASKGGKAPEQKQNFWVFVSKA